MKYEYVSVNYEAKNTVLAVISKHKSMSMLKKDTDMLALFQQR